MNKKIFTLLAGAFLMFASVFSVNAQVGHGLWDLSLLSVGDTVRTLDLGMNRGYYHLRADSVSNGNGTKHIITASGNPDSVMLLYMGKKQANEELTLYIDTINKAIKHRPSEFRPGAPKAEESAAGLWCVNIERYNNGKNIIFDFINKEHEEMLEVDVIDYENWDVPTDAASYVGDAILPGGVSGWEFSIPYATEIHTSRPLISYITEDTVAVLCIERATFGVSGVGDSIYVKIADAVDVQNGLVEGVLYFTLMHAAPFIINADDYNTYFGRKAGSLSAKLTFDPDADVASSNPFSNTLLTASYLPLADVAKRIVVNEGPIHGHNTTTNVNTWHPWKPAYIASGSIYPIAGANNYDTILYTASSLDSLGYMRFNNGANYVSVLTEYFTGNYGGNQYLKLGLKNNGYFGGTATDSLLYGQSAFRMVYYPSGDSIYINSYQATYLPSWDATVQNQFNAKQWTDSATLAVFTYFADSAALQKPQPLIGGTPLFWNTPIPNAADSLEMVLARLKYGRRTTDFHEPFTYHHKLYVTMQNLTGGLSATLHTSNPNNGQINTRIHFDLYNPCIADANQKKTTVPPDVYLIRNLEGKYLQVPLYSPTDSALWVWLEKDVDPRYVPSFHWVVTQRYVSSAISPITITNREFEWLQFDNVQLYNAVGPFRLRTKEFDWNTKDIHAGVTTWENKGNNDFAFINLAKEFKNNPKLGYTWIDPDTAVVNAYAFNLKSGIAADLNKKYYLGWQGNLNAYPNTDTTVYVNYDSYFDKMYFSLDTINEDGYGELQEYGYDAKNARNANQISDLVTLERQAYRLTYKDPFKYKCVYPFCLTPGEEKYYGISSKGLYKDFLGKPVFYLRDHYKVEGEEDPYFTLVQRIDTTTTGPGYTAANAAMRTYLEKIYGTQYTNIVMDRLLVNGVDNFNPGLFVAAFEPATTKLMMTLRAEENITVSAFKLEKDVDPLYRRFNTLKEGDEANDLPDFVHFFTINNTNEFLYENTGFVPNNKSYWEPGRKNYLGLLSKSTYPNADSHSSTIIYVDTAYVNRGTGYIKPQYLLAVRPTINEPDMGCDDQGEPTIPLPGYVEAYYLINAHDSAYLGGGRTNDDYLWDSEWTRLVFTRAIHANDYLYILGDHELPASIYGQLVGGAKRLDVTKLHAYAINPSNNIDAIYLGTNTHKDVVFQFRLAERRADDFYIESETTARDTINGPMIAPCEGGWVKIHNGVPVLTPSDEVDQIGQAELFNVLKASKREATSNDNVVASNVTVIGNDGAVTILNAAGKSVVINNILGQIVAKTILTSDNQTIPAPKGVVIVSVDGENAVKTLVK